MFYNALMLAHYCSRIWQCTISVHYLVHLFACRSDGYEDIWEGRTGGWGLQAWKAPSILWPLELLAPADSGKYSIFILPISAVWVTHSSRHAGNPVKLPFSGLLCNKYPGGGAKSADLVGLTYAAGFWYNIQYIDLFWYLHFISPWSSKQLARMGNDWFSPSLWITVISKGLSYNLQFALACIWRNTWLLRIWP